MMLSDLLGRVLGGSGTPQPLAHVNGVLSQPAAMAGLRDRMVEILPKGRTFRSDSPCATGSIFMVATRMAGDLLPPPL